MTNVRHHNWIYRSLSVTALMLAVTLFASIAGSEAYGETVITFQEKPKKAEATTANIPVIKMGVEEKRLRYSLNKRDKKAIKTAKAQSKLEDTRSTAEQGASVATERIAAIEELIIDTENDEQKLRQAIEARLVEQYQEGENRGLDFLFSEGRFSGIFERSKLLRERAERDQRLSDEYEMTLERLEQLHAVMSELRDIQNERVERLTDRINDLDGQVASARAAHMEAPVAPLSKDAKSKLDGTWYVMDGAFQAQLYLPMAIGSSYDGGTRTPRRAATPAEIAMILNDARIELTASGIADIANGQIDGRILGALHAAANTFNYVRVTSLKRDHGVYTASGNVSQHSYGCAVDIGTIGSTFIQPSAQVAGGEVEQAVRLFASLPGDLAPHQVISLFSLGGPTFAMGDHGDHIHVGYSC